MYHYTDKDSARKILKSGVIKQSDPTGPNQDAVAGKGVYCTKIKPGKISVQKVAENNYDDGTSLPQQKMKDGKFDVALKLKVPTHKVTKAVEDRNVYVHPGDISTSNVVDVKLKTKDDSYVSAKTK